MIIPADPDTPLAEVLGFPNDVAGLFTHHRQIQGEAEGGSLP